jgi:hypothetical protein
MAKSFRQIQQVEPHSKANDVAYKQQHPGRTPLLPECHLSVAHGRKHHRLEGVMSLPMAPNEGAHLVVCLVQPEVDRRVLQVELMCPPLLLVHSFAP